jgi:nucleotidyltransferase substrate binding protein (TIGR01987 family)
MAYNTHHFQRCIATLQLSIQMLKECKPDSTQYEVYRNAVIKGFELVLEMSGNLLRKALKSYGGTPKSVDDLSFKDVLRHAGKHGLLDTDAIARWFNYRNNRNVIAHDYGEKFAEQTLALLPGFIADASHLAATLQKIFAQESNVGS